MFSCYMISGWSAKETDTTESCLANSLRLISAKYFESIITYDARNFPNEFQMSMELFVFNERLMNNSKHNLTTFDRFSEREN